MKYIFVIDFKKLDDLQQRFIKKILHKMIDV